MKKGIVITLLSLFLFAFIGTVEASHDPPDGVEQISMTIDNVTPEMPLVTEMITFEVQGVACEIGKSYEYKTIYNIESGYLCNCLYYELDKSVLTGSTLRHSYSLIDIDSRIYKLIRVGSFSN